ncbi:MAG: hypothetical protein ACYCZR_02180 [Burkholderiales bacterium]
MNNFGTRNELRAFYRRQRTENMTEIAAKAVLLVLAVLVIAQWMGA